RRDIETSVRRRFPCHCWPEHETVHGIAACVLCRDVSVLHFYAKLEPLVRQENWRHRSLRKTPLSATVAGVLFFEEPVHGPLDATKKFLRQKQPNFVGIGNLWRAALFLFASAWRRWNFFVSNRADTEFVFGEDCRIERDLVPISQSPSGFQAHCLIATA